MAAINIYDYLNKRDKFRAMEDDEFDKLKGPLSQALVDYTFERLLKDYTDGLTPSLDDWTNLKKKRIDKDFISSTSVVGTNIIKRSMPHLYEVQNHKHKSIVSSWTQEVLEKVLVTNRKSHSTPYVSEIIRQVGFVSGTSKVTIYRPLLTKRIVERFNSKHVLDVCVGWGGRMLGSVCVDGVSYTGIEPFSKTYEGLEQMKSELELTDEQVTLHNECAETILPQLERKYDLALTSPPYYNLEIYTDEDTQSHHYGTYEDWVDNFLRPVIEGVLDKLVEGGKSCWSVKNFKTDGKYNLYDDVVRIHEENGWIPMQEEVQVIASEEDASAEENKENKENLVTVKQNVEFYVGNCLRPGLKDKDGNSKKSKEITYVFIKEP